MINLEVRDAVEDDSSQILMFIQDLASYEEAFYEVIAKEKVIFENPYSVQNQR